MINAMFSSSLFFVNSNKKCIFVAENTNTKNI